MADNSSDIVCCVLAEKLASNTKLLRGLLTSLSSEERKDLLGAHPELAETANGS